MGPPRRGGRRRFRRRCGAGPGRDPRPQRPPRGPVPWRSMRHGSPRRPARAERLAPRVARRAEHRARQRGGSAGERIPEHPGRGARVADPWPGDRGDDAKARHGPVAGGVPLGRGLANRPGAGDAGLAHVPAPLRATRGLLLRGRVRAWSAGVPSPRPHGSPASRPPARRRGLPTAAAPDANGATRRAGTAANGPRRRGRVVGAFSVPFANHAAQGRPHRLPRPSVLAAAPAGDSSDPGHDQHPHVVEAERH